MMAEKKEVNKEGEEEEEEEEEIVAKALHGQRYPMPLSKCMWDRDYERGSGPGGADDL